MLRTPLKTHGGKHYLAPWLIEHFPKDYRQRTYVEVFLGGGSVLLRKEPSAKEVANDLDKKIISVFRCIQTDPAEFLNLVGAFGGYTKETFENATLASDDATGYMQVGVCELIQRRMSRGGTKKSFAWSKRLRGGKPGDVNAYETILDMLPDISDRIAKVDFLNEDFGSVIEQFNDESIFFYLDPPYLQETRSKGSLQVYDHEMTTQDHVRLLDLCLESKALIMISGYESPLYRDTLDGWKFRHRSIANHSSQKDRKTLRTECIWCNY